jgi:hypothetical protein
MTSIIPFPTLGVKVSFFNVFIEEFGGNAFFEGKTTTEINELVVKPLMALNGSISFCEYMQTHARFGPSVNVATVFISHAWKYHFLDVFSAIQSNFDAETVVWFDLLSNNQTIAQDLDYTWWSTTFYDAIKLFGHVAMVLAPWNHPVPFTRGWCLYEIYCAIKTNSKFEVCLPNRQIENLFQTITTKSVLFGKLLHDIDVEKSECFNPLDLAHILDSVRQMDGGIARANHVVQTTLLSWLHIKIDEFARNSSQNILQQVQRLFAYGLFLKYSGLEGAPQLYLEALAFDINCYVDDVPDTNTLQPRSVRAGCFYELGVTELSRCKGERTAVTDSSGGEIGMGLIDYSKPIEYFHLAISEAAFRGGASSYALRNYYAALVEVHTLDGNSTELSRCEALMAEAFATSTTSTTTSTASAPVLNGNEMDKVVKLGRVATPGSKACSVQ